MTGGAVWLCAMALASGVLVGPPPADAAEAGDVRAPTREIDARSTPPIDGERPGDAASWDASSGKGGEDAVDERDGAPDGSPPDALAPSDLTARSEGSAAATSAPADGWGGRPPTNASQPSASSPSTAGGATSGSRLPATQEREDEPPYPRLVLGAHAALGPHSPGEEACRLDGYLEVCDRTGDFMALGASTDLRLRLIRFFYAQVQAQGGVNIARAFSDAPMHTGIVMPAFALMLMNKRAFVRVGVATPLPIGRPRHRTAGQLDQLTRDEWGPVAGVFGGGLRLRFSPRVRGELIAGMVLGPSAERRTINADFDGRRFMFTFTAGFGLSFDLLR